MPHKSYAYDLHGQTFAALTVLSREAADEGSRHARWLCQCECGAQVIVRGSKLRSGATSSCGCRGYRRSSEAHAAARAKVSTRKRKAIARKGGRARQQAKG